MKLRSFRIVKFRNIIDSGDVEVDESVTCLVGKNEAGKSAFLEALYLLNPTYSDDSFNLEEQYPRQLLVKDRKSEDISWHAPIQAVFTLEPEDKAVIEDVFGEKVLRGNKLIVRRCYNGEKQWEFKWNEETAIKALVAQIPETLTSHFEDVSTLEQFREVLRNDLTTDASPDDVNKVKAILRDHGLESQDIRERIVSLLEKRLPTFFRFTRYNTLPGRVSFDDIAQKEKKGPASSRIRTVQALLQLAGTDTDQLGNEEYELRKSELEAVQIELTNQVFKYWTQNPDLEVEIDVDKVTKSNHPMSVERFLEIRLRDRRTGYSNNFNQRSSGFQWFFSFLAAFSEFENADATIVLLDEPALTLHAKAQNDFLRFINERIASSSPVLYTTHSPFMVEADRLERVRIIEDAGPPKGAVCHDKVMAVDPDSLFPLQGALGYDIAQNLFIGPHNLVVEGLSDYIYLTVMSRICEEKERQALDNRWRVLPAGGATNIPTFVTLIGPRLDITVLADSNAQGMQRIKRMIDQKLLKGKRLILVSQVIETDNADIEDLFSERDYLELYNKTFGVSVRVEELPKGDRIVRRLESLQERFNHGKVAETLLRHYHEFNFATTTLDRFEELFVAVNNTLDT